MKRYIRQRDKDGRLEGIMIMQQNNAESNTRDGLVDEFICNGLFKGIINLNNGIMLENSIVKFVGGFQSI